MSIFKIIEREFLMNGEPSELRADRVRFIIAHTAAHGSKKEGKVFDTSAEMIDAWHKERGWYGIGYHYVIRLNGDIETGRSIFHTGAHCRGLNSTSVGVCFSGHGDIQPPTLAQLMAFWGLTAWLSLPFPMLSRVIGHRNVGQIRFDYATRKSCPGTKFDGAWLDTAEQILSATNTAEARYNANCDEEPEYE